ncbi:MAG: helix-turn-helix domain-containing protein [Scardovia wiggsiae]
MASDFQFQVLETAVVFNFDSREMHSTSFTHPSTVHRPGLVVTVTTLHSFFDLIVRWEYTVAPKHRFRKFVVVSNRQRYEELVAQRGETSVWYRRPIPGFDVSNPEVFSLEQFTIDGVDVAFQRHADSTSQVYVVDLGDEVIRAGKPVVVAFRFRTRTRQQGHVVHIDIDRPTRGLDIEFHYGDAAVAEARMLDFASIGEGGRVEDDRGTQTLRYRYDGWLFPRAGLVFFWSLPEAGAPARTRLSYPIMAPQTPATRIPSMTTGVPASDSDPQHKTPVQPRRPERACSCRTGGMTHLTVQSPPIALTSLVGRIGQQQDTSSLDSSSLDRKSWGLWDVVVPSLSPKSPLSAITGEFGRRVRLRREELELSQEKLAERCELHWTYIGQVECGQRNLSLHNIVRIAKGLVSDPGELVRGLGA